MAAKFPADLAKHVHAQLRERKERPPSLSILTKLFETTYFASLKQEEAQSISCRIAFVRRSRPDPDPPERIVADRWQVFPLAADLPLTVRNLVQLSTAVDPWGSTLAIDVDSESRLRIWGLIEHLVSLTEAETRRHVLAEHLARADVAPQDATRAVARGFRDGSLGRSSSRLHVLPCQPRRYGQRCRLHSCRHALRPSEDRRDRIAIQSRGSYVAVAIHSEEDCAVGYVRWAQIFAERSDWAGIFVFAESDRDLVAGLLFVGFRSRHVDHKPVS